MRTDSDGSGSFWKTLPGILTGIGTILGALAGVIGVLWQIGIIDGHTDDPPAAVVDVDHEPTEKALADVPADKPPADPIGGRQPAASEAPTIPGAGAGQQVGPGPALPQPPAPPAPAQPRVAEPAVAEPADDPAADVSDAGLAALRAGCASGDMIACDELFFSAPLDSDDERFGWTCGGLIPEKLTAGGDCELLFG